MISIVLWALIGFLFFIGLFGSLIPLLPAPILVIGGILIFVFWKGVVALGLYSFIFLMVLGALAMIVDNVASVLGAKKYGASKKGIAGAMVGALAGLVVGGPIGVILGPLAGAFLFEYLGSGDLQKAKKISWGTFLGFLSGSVARFVLVIIMIAWFLIKVF